MISTKSNGFFIFAYTEDESILPNFSKLYGADSVSIIMPPNNTGDPRLEFYQVFEITWSEWANIDTVCRNKSKIASETCGISDFLCLGVNCIR